ncbi:hypothetical protein CK203_066674 [Vitis vinifera]|uniref:Uncharacterized protein n=1 Tax=Vitis vinifera TaxID=29760 RepID=A0A438EUY6_VITVI|nr:hypothetical protein CK203_066674 [Vitis vinifera]
MIWMWVWVSERLKIPEFLEQFSLLAARKIISSWWGEIPAAPLFLSML